MSEPKRHHYVPKVLLRNFVDEAGELFVYDKDVPLEGIRRRSPTMVLRELHLYTTVSATGERDSSQEQRYQRLETSARPVLDKLIDAARAGRLPALVPAEKLLWDEFIYEQWRRVPEQHRSLYKESDWEAQIADAVKSLELRIGRALRSDELDQVAEFSVERRFRHGVLVGALGKQSTNALATLGNRGLFIGRAPVGRSFVVGSRPIVRFRSPTSDRLDDHGVEFWLPIAHDVIVSPGAARGTEQMLDLDIAMVRKVNRAAWKQSSKVVAKSAQLLTSLLAQR